ncbi:MAG: hypothetical protein EPN88_12285 [Bacteroidetes bacterium]|nr:MAG: hypothetical protein EPN88_12285 [Bacteroidota bacterium]
MKKSQLFGIIVILTIISCEKIDHEVFFKIGSDLEFKFSDIELYDTSTHILYFKNSHAEFDEMLKNTFAFMDNGEIIYQGSFLPGYSSSIPNGPYIMSPPMYGNYALKIENGHFDKPDIRMDQRIINVLKQHDLLHSGLAISSGSIEIAGSQLSFKFTITNQDQSDLMVIDPDKTGPNLFHYFTNGLRIYDLAHNDVFSGNIQHQAPDPWNSWKIDWLSELKSGDSKEFTINYTINNPINPGEYDTYFEFPGLAYQVTKDQLYQGSYRIWLGDISLNKRRTIQ